MRLGMSIRGQFSASDVPIRVVGVFFFGSFWVAGWGSVLGCCLFNTRGPGSKNFDPVPGLQTLFVRPHGSSATWLTKGNEPIELGARGGKAGTTRISSTSSYSIVDTHLALGRTTKGTNPLWTRRRGQHRGTSRILISNKHEVRWPLGENT